MQPEVVWSELGPGDLGVVSRLQVACRPQAIWLAGCISRESCNPGLRVSRGYLEELLVDSLRDKWFLFLFLSKFFY